MRPCAGNGAGRAISRECGGRMRSWEVRRRKAEKRRREADRREKRRATRGERQFRLVRVDAGSGEVSETFMEEVIVKNRDESVFAAAYDEIQEGMVLVVEGESGRIERAVVEEKLEGSEEDPVRTVRIRSVS